MDVRWRIELLGGLRVEGAGQVLTRFRTQKTGLLLAYLALYRRRIHSREALIELFWPESEPDAGRNSLSQALSWLRRQLEPPGVPVGAVLVADRAAVRVSPDVVTTDVATFEAALRAAANTGSDAERAERLAQAVALYRGPLLAGHHEQWLLGERERLAQLYCRALRHLIKGLERAGDVKGALPYARRGVRADPLSELAQRDLIRLLAAAGQPSAALRQYRELERLLKQELGAAPAAATRALAREIERLASPPNVSLMAPPAAAPPIDRPTRAAMSADESSPPPGEGENRVVTVLFADTGRTFPVAGNLYPEDAAALLNHLLRSIADVLGKYEGQEHRFLSDRVLAVFGVSQAHEHDPERAIRAAMEVGEAARRLGLDLPVGIDTGEVFVGEVGTGQHPEWMVVGPVVHRAARLLERAEPGQILVGADTYRPTRRAFVFSRLALSIRGRGGVGPVAAYAVTAALPRPEKGYGIEGIRTALIGREKELTALREALAGVLQGRGQMVSLVGEAGVGKSRLVAELKAALGSGRAAHGEGGPCSHRAPRAQSPEPPLWLEGRCLEMGMTATYSLFVDLFRGYFAWRPEESDAERGERLVACLRDLVARGGLPAERVEEMGPLLGNLLSLRFGNDWDDRLKNASSEQIRHQTLLAIRDFVLALARRQALLLILEDLHWADSLSLDEIPLLIETLTDAPLLLLCIYRPEREHRCRRLAGLAMRKCAGEYREIHLPELTRDQSRQLVDALAGGEGLPVRVRDAILEKARGNPLFIEEVIRALIDAGLLYRKGTGAAADEPPATARAGALVWRGGEGAAALTLPESVQSLIRSRVDRLAPELKRVLASAAVIGRLFRRRWLEPMIPEAAPLDRALWALEERGLIDQEQVVPEEEYSFNHVLTQETIYRSLLRGQRAALHQRVAAVIEVLYPEGLEAYYEQLAYHYERSEAHEKAIEYLLKAGEKARRAYLTDEAVGYFQRTLERLAESGLGEARKEWRLAALRGLGQTHLGIGRLAEAEGNLRKAIALAQQIGLAPRELVRLYWWLANVLFWQSQYDEEIQIAEEGQALLGEDTASVEAALLNHVIALGYGARGDRDRFRALHRRNAQFLQRLPYLEELMLPVYHDLVQCCYFYERDVEEAMKWVQALQSNAEQQQGLTTLGVAHKLRAEISLEQGELRGSISHSQQALERYLKVGDAKAEVRILALIGWAFLYLGELSQAEKYFQRWLGIAEGMGYTSDVASSSLAIGILWLCQGACANAMGAFQRAAELCKEIGSPAEVLARLYLGRAYLDQRRRREALRQFLEPSALVRLNELLPVEGRPLPGILSGIEAAYEDPETFRRFCCRFREQHPEVRDAPSAQWFLESTRPSTLSPLRVHDVFVAPLSSDWVWRDPFGDCFLIVENGLEIHAANGRGLQHINQSAPRLLRPADGEFAVQTLCLPVSEEKPAIGGLLLWKDRGAPPGKSAVFLRLEKGTRGAQEVSFMGCLDNEDLIIGRGRLPAQRIYLRLERFRDRVNALCSADGEEWFTVGTTAFPGAEPVQVGLYAIGAINRSVYPGAYPNGTAIRFESFQLYGPKP